MDFSQHLRMFPNIHLTEGMVLHILLLIHFVSLLTSSRKKIIDGLPTTGWGHNWEDKNYDDGYGKAKWELKLEAQNQK